MIETLRALGLEDDPGRIKEFLQLRILSALAETPLAGKLTFQGGTALRLAYGGLRLSEDLDFVHSEPLTSTEISRFETGLKRDMAERYGLESTIREQKRTPEDIRIGLQIGRWVVKTHIPASRPDLKQIHRVVVETAAVPAYDASLRVLDSPVLSLDCPPTLLRVSSEEEILADKVLAIAERKYLKARDLWDVKFLTDKRTILRVDWVRDKARDYGGSTERLVERLKRRITSLSEPTTALAFRNEMSRFLVPEISARCLTPEGASSILEDVSRWLDRQSTQLTQAAEGTPGFAPDM